MNTLQLSWDGFDKRVIHKDAPDVQRNEMRLAFYGGAAAVLQIMMAVSGDEISEDAGAAILEGLHQEVRQFISDITA